MKKTKRNVLLLSAILLMTSFNQVLADEDFTEAETNVIFEFKKASVEDPNLPPTPENPTDPSDPHPGANTDFRIWLMPSSFIFEPGSFSSSDEMYPMKDNLPTAVAVADLRDVRDGWRLYAQLSEITNNRTSNEIEGASISWIQEVKEIIDMSSGNVVDSDVEAPKNVTISNVQTLVMAADQEKGVGYHMAILNDVSLNIPAKQGESGSYSGTVKWTLSRTPNVRE